MAIASPSGKPAAARHSLDLSATELLAWRRSMLALAGGGADAASRLDWLLDLAGGLSWPALQALWLHPQRRIQLRCSLQELENLWQRHHRNAEPLQYLVGRCPWRDLELSVAPGVLIPRQETELLLELALAEAAAQPSGSPLCWADLGTGSGCLAVALARALPHDCGLAVDASQEALRQAASNLRALLPPRTRIAGPYATEPQATVGAEPQTAVDGKPEPGAGPSSRMLPGVQLLQGSWWQAIEPWWGRLQLVVSNPPYIPSAVLAALEPVVRDHEPALALDGGADGLTAIRRIAAGAAVALAPGGVLLLEHHHDQSEAVLALLAEAGLEECHAHRDLEGVLRFASARRPAEPDGPMALSPAGIHS
jgi:release factor glutamine methyltransferase